MKKRIVCLVMAMMMLIGVYPARAISAEEVKIVNTLTIKVGETKPLKITDPNGNKVNVIWESDNPDIATVDSAGNVKAKKAGSCVISCWWNSKLYGVKIVVKAAAKKIALTKTKLTLTVGKKATLKLKNAKASKVKWSSSNKKVATVSKGVVKAKKAGKVTITATYKKKKYRCKITVKKKGLTEKQAFNKLKNYLLKHGIKNDTGVNVFYSIYWKKDDIEYELTYNKGNNEILFQSHCFVNGEVIMSDYLSFGAKKQAYFTFDTYSDNQYDYTYFNKRTFQSSKGISFKNSSDNFNRQAQGYLQWTLPEYNKKIKKLVKVNLKQLGFKKWDK